MGDLDFDELDKAINELYETLGLDDEPDNGAGAQSMPKDDDSNRPVADGDDNKSTGKSVAEPVKSSKRRPVQDVRRPVASDQEQSDASSDTTNSLPDDGGRGRFMDMVHPSSDTQLQHKHNFASERQAELDAKLATEAESTESNQDDTKPQEPVQIAVSIEEDDVVIESTTKPTSIQIDDSDNVEIDTETETEPESESQTEVEPESKVAAETGESLAQSTAKPQVTTAGRRGVQYRGDNRRTWHDLAQPLPIAPAALSASEVVSDDVGAKQYDTPFLPDAKVSKRPLGQVNRRSEAVSPKAASNQSTNNHQSEVSDVKPDVVVAKPTKSKTSEAIKSRHETKPHQAMSHRDYTRLHQTESGQPVASRHSVSTSDDGLTLNTRRSKALVMVGRMLLFLAIIIMGGLAGVAFYYCGW